MVKTRALFVLVASLVGSAAYGQPTVTIDPLPPELTRLNRQDFTVFNPDAPDTPIRLVFRASFFSNLGQSIEAEITYDRARTEQMPDGVTRVVVEETGQDNYISAILPNTPYEVFIKPSNLLPPDSPFLSATGADPASETSTERVVVRVGTSGGSDGYLAINHGSANLEFFVDTKAPLEPTITSTVPGEDRILVTWNIPEGEQVEDLQGYEVQYCPQVTGMVTETATLADLPCPEDERLIASTGNTVTQAFLEDGIVNNSFVVVRVRAVDESGNEGEWSSAWPALPRDVTDFFELYRQEGGTEEGGFCFVATAAYGSYAHPVVRILRGFRDGVLERSPLGSAVVRSYYEASPPVAAALEGRPLLAALARILLVLIAVGLLALALAPVLALGWWAARRLRKVAVAAGLALGLLVLLAPSAAQAERPKSALGNLGLGFEFKGGPYLPALGDAEGNNPAFGRIFGTNSGPMFKLGLELQLWREFGTISVGGSIGYQRFSGQGLLNDQSGGTTSVESQDKTRLYLLPTSLVAIYRFDYLAEHTWLPLVPYVKGGLAYMFWWSTNGRGNISRLEGQASDGGDLIARGGKLGFTGTVGLSFLLNALEPRAATSLYNASNIRGTYVFAELEVIQADGFSSDGFDLSDVTWNVGLMLEF